MIKLDFLRKSRMARLGFLALSGILTGLCLCYPVIGIFEWVSLIPAALVFYVLADSEKNRLRSFYIYGFFFCMCYFTAVWHWFFSMYPMEYTGMSKPAAFSVLCAAVLGLPLLQSSTFSFVFVLFGLIKRGGLSRRFPIFAPFAAAALWAVLEWSQTLFWVGVPWGRLALGQTKMLVFVQSASLFGSYFVTFAIVSVNFLLAYALCKAGALKLFAITAAAVFAANTALGGVILLCRTERGTPVTAAVIQGNISSADKWEVDWQELTFERYGDLTRQAAAQGAKIVVWPESVIISYIEYDADSQRFISDLARECEVTLLVGVLSMPDNNTQYNSILTVNPDGSFSEQTYSKRHLVPFGEYVPWRRLTTALVPALEDVSMLEDDFSEGEGSQLTETVHGKIGSIICFDSIYEELARKSAGDGAELIALETNDSWFYDSAAIYMHLAQAQLRAIENGKYIVRAANTGISAIIAPNGSVTQRLDPLVQGICVDTVYMNGEKTLYTHIGNLWVWLSVCFVVGIISYDAVSEIIRRRTARAAASAKQ